MWNLKITFKGAAVRTMFEKANKVIPQRRATGSEGFSLSTELIADIFDYAKPLGHSEAKENCNLGFGFLYYGAVRSLRPEHVVVIGSGFGFSVVCLALGLKDNGKGRLTFVDPSYDVFKQGPFKTVGGRGYWRDAESVQKHFSRFGVEELITHHKLTNKEFFPKYESLGLGKADMAFVDGNHSYDNAKYDFTEILIRSHKNTYIFLHDTNIYIREIVRNSGVKRWLKLIRKQRALFEFIDFPFSSGVAMVRVLQDDAWKELNP
jgi:predicted O-methyltransferase YrrM